MWSVPPAEPPAHDTEPGSAFSLAVRSASVWSVGGRGNDDHFVLAGEAGDRRDGVERDRRLVGEDGADHDVAADHEAGRVAVGFLRELGEADGAAGAGYVDDLHVARHALGGHGFLQGARCLVPAAAGGGRAMMV